MMYTHTITVYDRDGELVKTIPDSVELTKFGVAGHPGVSQGAPVEAAVDAAHRNVYASNYSMYGANFGPEGSDRCGGPSGLSPSYVYRVSLKTLAINGVAQVGMVPKYVAVTPDDRYVLATNWCSYDLSVVDRNSLREVKRVPLGAYPRGIAVAPSGRTRTSRSWARATSRASTSDRSRSRGSAVSARRRAISCCPPTAGACSSR